MRVRRDILNNPNVEQVWTRIAGGKLENVTLKSGETRADLDTKKIGAAISTMVHNHPNSRAIPSPQDLITFGRQASKKGLKYGWIVKNTPTGKITQACCVVIPSQWKIEEHKKTFEELEMLRRRSILWPRSANKAVILRYLKKLGWRIKFFNSDKFKGTDATRKKNI